MRPIIFVLIIVLCLGFTSAYSQTEDVKYIDNYLIMGGKKGTIDTLGNLTVKDISQKNVGLLEKEIKPEEYIMGPNDVLTISFITTKPKQYPCTVSPDGRLMIPEVGIVNCKGLSLKQADELIQNAVAKVFKSKDVSVTLTKLREFKVTVSGAVFKPVTVTATAVDRVSEIIERAAGFKNTASLRRIKVYRDDGNKIIDVDLQKFYLVGMKNANPTVAGGDQIIIPPSSKEQSININGEVPSPGEFEFVPGDSLSTLFKFAQGFISSSNLDSVEIARFSEKGSEVYRFFVSIENWRNKLFSGETLPNDLALKVGDRVFVRQKSDWFEKREVTIAGEVHFPGKYAVNKYDTRVRDIISRAGGITDIGALESSMLKRRKEISKEDPEMTRLYRIPYSEMSENERRYFQARVNEQKGVMAINFRKIMEDSTSLDNILVVDEDSIYVPQKQVFVNVQGRVNNPGLVIFKPGLKYMDYIALAGGYGYRADINETLIVKKKGEQFLAKNMNYSIEPGDNILVPPESETTFFDVFAKTLTVTTQILAIVGVVLAIRK